LVLPAHGRGRPRYRRAPQHGWFTDDDRHVRPVRDGGSTMSLTRRQFLGAAGAAGMLAATGGWRVGAEAATGLGGAPAAGAGRRRVPAPDASGIEHIVVVMMENRSFDHFLGWMP